MNAEVFIAVCVGSAPKFAARRYLLGLFLDDAVQLRVDCGYGLSIVGNVGKARGGSISPESLIKVRSSDRHHGSKCDEHDYVENVAVFCM